MDFLPEASGGAPKKRAAAVKKRGKEVRVVETSQEPTAQVPADPEPTAQVPAEPEPTAQVPAEPEPEPEPRREPKQEKKGGRKPPADPGTGRATVQAHRPAAAAKLPPAGSPMVSRLVLTKYEKAKIIGMRAEQLTRGGQAFVDFTVTDSAPFDPYGVAHQELLARRLPFIVVRHLPDGKTEHLHLDDPKLQLHLE
jgi:DNA-directed RNA polymerase subunit K/omega